MATSLINTKDMPTSWGKVRVQSKKTALIYRYVNTISEERGFDRKKKGNLITLIEVGIVSGCFGNSNIIIENGVIVRIDGIVEYENNFIIDPKLISDKPSMYKPRESQKIETSTAFSKVTPFWKQYSKVLDRISKGGLSDDATTASRTTN